MALHEVEEFLNEEPFAPSEQDYDEEEREMAKSFALLQIRGEMAMLC